MVENWQFIKVNLPNSEEKYISGNGEGCFVIVDEETRKLYDEDDSGTMCEGILDNDSLYYPDLKHGVRVPFETRGDRRPVVPWSWLYGNYTLSEEWKITEE